MIIIVLTMRPGMTTRAHAFYLGIHYTLNTAREVMFWPKMQIDLTTEVQCCSTCEEAKPAQVKEPCNDDISAA